MKKITWLAAVLLCVLSIAACSMPSDEVGNPIEDVVAASNPTEVITQVVYMYPNTNPLSEYNRSLGGFYTLKINGADSIFSYNFAIPASPEDMSEDGINYIEGTLYCKDGKTSVDGDTWTAISADTVNAKLNLIRSSFKTYEKSKDEKKLTATITGDNMESVIGHKLSAVGDVNFVLKTNGIYLTAIEISYKSTSGADVIINTSYTYGTVELEFPA